MATALPLYDALDELLRIIPGERARLTRIARREGLGPEDALDCVQDAFCTLMKQRQAGIPSEPGGPSLGATLATMVRNAARNKRRLHHVSRPHDAIDSLEPSDDGISTEMLVAHAEEHLKLRACVARLCDSQRAVVTLRMLEERDGEDVAELLGISRGHVDVLLHRAKSRLRSCMLAHP
ncbi:MAG: sigma-70 family RNA polymerase sigma factor [Polyangiaceae bacterium]|nr:sigma-70 family RNA polymerase sigma factor [Polyangiaceae bacterium]